MSCIRKSIYRSTSPKTYWSIIKSFLNKKIPCILPFFYESGFITDFKLKAELLNSFFARQCSSIKNNSKIPSIIFLKADKSLSNVTFEQNIEKCLLNFNPNKAHGHNKLSIRMLQIFGKHICKCLGIIFKSSIEKRCSPPSVKEQMLYPSTKNWQTAVEELPSIITITAENMKFSIKDFFRKLRIWSHLLKESLVENFIFCVVYDRIGQIYGKI